MNWIFKREYDIGTDEFRVATFTRDIDPATGKKKYAVLTVKDRDTSSGSLPDEAITIPDPALLQAIMDGLWTSGMRPTGFSGSEPVAAMKNHISDLQKIAFKLAGVEDK